MAIVGGNQGGIPKKVQKKMYWKYVTKSLPSRISNREPLVMWSHRFICQPLR